MSESYGLGLRVFIASWQQCIVGVAPTRASSPESLGTDPGCQINDPALDESMSRINKHGLNGLMRLLIIGNLRELLIRRVS